MATRWTSRFNPLSWITARRARTAPVAPGGQREYASPPAYQLPPEADYKISEQPFQGRTVEWFAKGTDRRFHMTEAKTTPATMDQMRPRTRRLEYDAEHEILRVTYRDGVTYEYEHFDQEAWDQLSSERYSTGKWLDTNLLSIDQGTRV